MKKMLGTTNIFFVYIRKFLTQGRRNVFEHGKDRYFQNGPSSLSDPGQKLPMKIKYRLDFSPF